jgi:hypothetical protein
MMTDTHLRRALASLFPYPKQRRKQFAHYPSKTRTKVGKLMLKIFELSYTILVKEAS